MTVINLSPGRMTAAQYEVERSRLRELYGDSGAEAAAKRDQALAILFYRSGWTQEELAEKEGKTRQWVAYRLRFGRFLNFATTVANSNSPPINLTEGRFRSLWSQTDKADLNERTRFREVLRLMQDRPAGAVRRSLFAEMKALAVNGQWHEPKFLAAKLNATPGEVEEMLLRIYHDTKPRRFGCHRKRVGTGFQYRVFKQDKTVTADELIQKLSPIIKGLKIEGEKNMATISISAVLGFSGRLQNLINEWTK